MSLLAAMIDGLRQRSVQLVVDVSNAQGKVAWPKVAASGIHAGFAKATEGVHYIDAYHAMNRAGAAQAKVHLGLYHFARPDLNAAEDEADHFASLVGQLHQFELVPALDMETAGHTGAVDAVDWARRFNRRFQSHLGVWPLFYSYSAFIDGMRRNAPEARPFYVPIGGGLWLANYGRNDGQEHPVTVPAPWKKVRLHQFTSRGQVAGVAGPCDLSHAHSLPLVGKAAGAGA